MPDELHLRAALVNGTHVETARKILSNTKTNIRLIGASGPGYGNQKILVNFVNHLRYLGYEGTIELIALCKSPLTTTHEPPLPNLLKLFNINGFEGNFLEIKELKLIFYDYAYFKTICSSLPKVDWAFFPGSLKMFKINFGNAGIFSYDFERNLARLGKAKRAIYFNFYTLSSPVTVGYISQLEHQTPRHNYPSKTLFFPEHSPSSERIRGDLTLMLQHKPGLAKTLNTILDLRKAREINTLAAYAMHHQIEPEFSMVNLLIGSSEANAHSQKPLIMLLLSPIPDKSWRRVQQLVNERILEDSGIFTSSKIDLPSNLTASLQNLSGLVAFSDVIAGHTLPNLTKHPIVLLRLPSLSDSIFYTLAIDSFDPVVYEGVNLANSLKSAHRWGIPCPITDVSPHGQISRVSVADALELPKKLKDAGYVICSTNRNDFLEAWQKQKTPNQYVIEAINATHSPREVMAGDDRLAYAIAKVSREPLCEERFDAQICDWIEIPPQYQAPHTLWTTGSGFAYGVFEETLTLLFQRNYGMSADNSEYLANLIALSLQTYLNGDWSRLDLARSGLWNVDWLGLAIVSLQLVSCCIPPQHRTSATTSFSLLMFIVTVLPKIWSADPMTLAFFIALTASFMTARCAGKLLVQYSPSAITHFFAAAPRSDAKQDESTLDDDIPEEVEEEFTTMTTASSTSVYQRFPGF